MQRLCLDRDWERGMREDDDGPYVLYADAIDPVKIAEELNKQGFVVVTKEQWDGQNAALAAKETEIAETYKRAGDRWKQYDAERQDHNITKTELAEARREVERLKKFQEACERGCNNESECCPYYCMNEASDAEIAALRKQLAINNPCGHTDVESCVCPVCGYPDPPKMIKDLRKRCEEAEKTVDMLMNPGKYMKQMPEADHES